MTTPNVGRAPEFLARALRILEHVNGRAKQDQRGVEAMRGLIESAIRELDPETRQRAIKLELPPGTIEGRKNIRRGDWVR